MRIQDPRVHLRVEVDRQAWGTQYASALNVYKKTIVCHQSMCGKTVIKQSINIRLNSVLKNKYRS